MIDVNPDLKQDQFRLVCNLIYKHAGIALPESKLMMVQGRLAKRLRALKLDSFGEYLDSLQQNLHDAELVEFINCLTTNKTDFFRENHHFQFLTNSVLPPIRQALEAGQRKLRIWSAACSTGEEPYSIAMTLREHLAENVDMRILASDVDTEVLKRANEGIYSSERVAEMPKYLLMRYFEKQIVKERHREITQWQARQSLRDLIGFRRINFQDDPWAINTKFDVILCRNAMIYFDAETQRRLVSRFADYLEPEGHLIIGHSETLSGISDRFEPVGTTTYRLKSNRVGTSSQPSTARSSGISTSLNLNLPPVEKPQPYTLARTKEVVHPIIVGEIHATWEHKWISTLLGSCVAACLYDERVRVGGMNHFMLPTGGADQTTSASYGVHAMEMLINSMMKLGADRRRLKAKLFGGAAVIRVSDSRWNVGLNNIDFAKKFLTAEGIPLVASHTGGLQAMHVRFNSRSGKALVRLLDDRSASQVVEAEKQQPKQPRTDCNAVTLF